MKQELSKVRTGGKVVTEITINIYDSLSEITDAGFDEAKIVDKFNRMNKIDLQGEARNQFITPKPGKQAAKMAAFNTLTSDELLSCVNSETGACDAQLLMALVAKKMASAKASA